jgi:hypothetical protein
MDGVLYFKNDFNAVFKSCSLKEWSLYSYVFLIGINVHQFV